METKTQWRPGPTVCRCCLAEGCYKDISTEYFWMGKREVYSEMLSDTLDIVIAYSQSSGPNTNSRLICEPCISRLRDASEFKKQVLECEKTFMQHLDPGRQTPTLEVDIVPVDSSVKVETVKVEKRLSDEDFDDRIDFGGIDDDDDLDDEPLTKLASKIPKTEKVDLLDLLDNAKVTGKRKSSSKSKTTSVKKSKTKSKDLSQPSASTTKAEKKKKGSTLGNLATKSVSGPKEKTVFEYSNVHFRHRKNAELILKYSTAIPFKTVWSKIVCSYCCEVFEEFTILKSHVEASHKTANVKDVFYKLSDNLANVDITDLKCKLCGKDFEDIKTLMPHLFKEHNLPVIHKCSFGVMPFKRQSGNWICVFCSQVFVNFKVMKRHMPNHFQNYICKLCDSTFVTDNALRLHVKMGKCTSVSKEGRFLHQLKHRRNAEIILDCSTAYPFRTWGDKLSCVFCRDVFINPSNLRQHIDTKHREVDTLCAFYKCLRKEFLKIDITDLKCKICSSYFSNIETLMKHLNDVHNKALDLNAQMGVLPFILDPACWKCLYCGQELSDCPNLIKHTSAHFLNYVCHTCGKGFITEHALSLHSKVPHENVISCYRCSASFPSIEDRKNHIRDRHTKTPYMCHLCKGKPRFSSWDSKQKHLLEIHNCQPNSYECTECQMTFKSRSAKYKHVRKVHSEKQYPCKYCNLVFTSKVILDNHSIKKHIGE